MSSLRQQSAAYTPLRYVDAVRTPQGTIQFALGIVIPTVWAAILSTAGVVVLIWSQLIQTGCAACAVAQRAFDVLIAGGSLADLKSDISLHLQAETSGGGSPCVETHNALSDIPYVGTVPATTTAASVAELFEFDNADTPRNGISVHSVPRSENPLYPVSGKIRHNSNLSSGMRSKGRASRQNRRSVVQRLRSAAQGLLCWVAGLYILVRPIPLLGFRIMKRLANVWKGSGAKKVALSVPKPSVAGPAHVVVVFGAGSLEGEAAVRLHSFRIREVKTDIISKRTRDLNSLNNDNLKGPGEGLIDTTKGLISSSLCQAVAAINGCSSAIGLKPLITITPTTCEVRTIVEPTGCLVLACDSDVVSLRHRYRRYPGVQCLPYYWGGRDDTARVKEVVAQSRRSLFAMIVIVPNGGIGGGGLDRGHGGDTASHCSISRAVSRTTSRSNLSTGLTGARTIRMRGDLSTPVSARSYISTHSMDRPALRSKASWCAGGVAVVHQNKWATIPELDEFCSEEHLSATVVPRVLQPLRIAKDLLPFMIGCAQAHIGQFVTPPEWDRLTNTERLVLDALYDIVSPSQPDTSSPHSDAESDSSDSQCLFGSVRSGLSRSSNSTNRSSNRTSSPLLPAHMSGAKPRIVLVTSSTRPLRGGSTNATVDPLQSTVTSASSAATGGSAGGGGGGGGFSAFMDVSLMLAALSELQRSPYCMSGAVDIISICHVHCDHATVVQQQPTPLLGIGPKQGDGLNDSISKSIGMRSEAFQSILEAKDPRATLAALKSSLPKFPAGEAGLHYDSPYPFSVCIPLVDFCTPAPPAASVPLSTLVDSNWENGRETSPTPGSPTLTSTGSLYRVGLGRSVSPPIPTTTSPEDVLVLCRDRSSLDSWALDASDALGSQRLKLSTQVERYRARSRGSQHTQQ